MQESWNCSGLDNTNKQVSRDKSECRRTLLKFRYLIEQNRGLKPTQPLSFYDFYIFLNLLYPIRHFQTFLFKHIPPFLMSWFSFMGLDRLRMFPTLDEAYSKTIHIYLQLHPSMNLNSLPSLRCPLPRNAIPTITVVTESPGKQTLPP